MAYADLEKKKIYGCEKGSKTYYHELYHLKYEDTTGGRITRINQQISNRTLLLVVALGVIYPLAVIKIMIVVVLLWSIFSEIREELDCWRYAENKTREKDVRCSKRKIQKV